LAGRQNRLALAAVCSGFLLVGRPALAADDLAGKPPAIPVAQAEPGLDALLAKVEQQVTSGHTFFPADDNALDTWPHVVQRALPGSPESSKVLADFVARVRDRAAGAKAAGSNDVAVDLALFQDLAAALLAGAGPAPVAAAPQTVTEGHGAVGPVATAAATSDQGGATAATASASPPRPPDQQVATRAAAPSAAPAPTVQAPTASAAAPDASRSRRVTEMPAAPQAALAGRAALAAGSAAGAPIAQQQSLAALYVKRGDAMLTVKDISGARKFYEYAADAGSARAARALAETYDPAWLGKLGAVGIRPDPALAAQWYSRAQTLGDPDAGARLLTLTAQVAK
jgi:hypothetical protein